jgi:ribose/xylose/arabinose/galactoside ABC-type transport system permease subunit
MSRRLSAVRVWRLLLIDYMICAVLASIATVAARPNRTPA